MQWPSEHWLPQELIRLAHKHTAGDDCSQQGFLRVNEKTTSTPAGMPSFPTTSVSFLATWSQPPRLGWARLQYSALNNDALAPDRLS